MSSETNYKHELVGAFGDPIAENPTGVMQEAAFAALGLAWRYQLIQVHHGDLEAAINGIRAMNFQGINLSIPTQWVERNGEGDAVQLDWLLLMRKRSSGKSAVLLFAPHVLAL